MWGKNGTSQCADTDRILLKILPEKSVDKEGLITFWNHPPLDPGSGIFVHISLEKLIGSLYQNIIVDVFSLHFGNISIGTPIQTEFGLALAGVCALLSALVDRMHVFRLLY